MSINLDDYKELLEDLAPEPEEISHFSVLIPR